jgi:hypothetical protein
MYPRIHLAIDNCFASKRWTHPMDWMRLCVDFGIPQIEASADNECDPLYTPPDALADWCDAVRQASEATGGRVVNFYSGHGSYATLGLAHPDARVKDHIEQNWLGRMIDQASGFGAGLGFFCHALDQAILNDITRYQHAIDDLYTRLARIAQRAVTAGLPYVSVEQMYSPHQPPWTIRGSLELLREVWKRAEAPLYLTLDVGHAGGQRNFPRPMDKRQSTREELYAATSDSNPYEWLRHLGTFAPIIHLQQTDGTSSSHRPFTQKYNEAGIITPRAVLEALKQSFDAPESPGCPPRVQDIWLTLEVFSGTAQPYDEIIRQMRESADYWRSTIPEDGLPLDRWV